MTNTLSALALLVAALGPGASGDESLPGRDRNYTVAESNVEGTMWKGADGEGVTTFYFERGGVLAYTTHSGTWRNGTWRQDGEAIYLEMNKKYAEYHGVLRGDRMAGSAENVKGLRWQFDVNRLGPIPKEYLGSPR